MYLKSFLTTPLLLVLLFSNCWADGREAKLRNLLSEGAVVYYGHESRNPATLGDSKVVILEPTHWTTRSLCKLRGEGKVIIGYLSVGELICNTRTRKDYRVLSKNEHWNSLRIDPSDPDWKKTMLRRTRLAKARGLDGLMLDTVDITDLHPEASESMTALIKAIRKEMPRGYLMVNRGFSILKDVRDSIDGVVFENANNRNFSARDKAWVRAKCEMLRELSLPVLILNYAEHSDSEEAVSLAQEFDWSFYNARSATLAKPVVGQP